MSGSERASSALTETSALMNRDPERGKEREEDSEKIERRGVVARPSQLGANLHPTSSPQYLHVFTPCTPNDDDLFHLLSHFLFPFPCSQHLP